MEGGKEDFEALKVRSGVHLVKHLVKWLHFFHCMRLWWLRIAGIDLISYLANKSCSSWRQSYPLILKLAMTLFNTYFCWSHLMYNTFFFQYVGLVCGCVFWYVSLFPFSMLLLWLFYLMWEVGCFFFSFLNLGKSYFKTTEIALGLDLSDLDSDHFSSSLKVMPHIDPMILVPFLSEFSVAETVVVTHYLFWPKFLTFPNSDK